jgi:hypothetical protein
MRRPASSSQISMDPSSRGSILRYRSKAPRPRIRRLHVTRLPGLGQPGLVPTLQPADSAKNASTNLTER